MKTTGHVTQLNNGEARVEFIFNRQLALVCNHCGSGFVIFVVGVENHKLTKIAPCTLDVPGHALYCPWCGLDMKD